MRTTKFILPLLIIALNFISCRKDHLLPISGKGENITESRNITGFTGIDLGMDADVYYQQDSVYRVEISAQSNVLPVLKTVLKGNVLEITMHTWIVHAHPITITIHSPNIIQLSISGSGNINVQNAIATKSLDVLVSGSGDVSIPSLTAQSLNADISGSGNVSISGGSVSDEYFSVNGSGDIDALSLTSSTSRVKVSGSGNILVTVLQSLTATISGSGNVKYKGTPAIEADVTGSGKIIRIN
jgi:hypothetical protein